MAVTAVEQETVSVDSVVFLLLPAEETVVFKLRLLLLAAVSRGTGSYVSRPINARDVDTEHSLHLDVSSHYGVTTSPTCGLRRIALITIQRSTLPYDALCIAMVVESVDL